VSSIPASFAVVCNFFSFHAFLASQKGLSTLLFLDLFFPGVQPIQHNTLSLKRIKLKLCCYGSKNKEKLPRKKTTTTMT